PAYISRHGMPRSPDAMEGHRAVGFISSRTGQIMPLEFTVGNTVRFVSLPCRLTVNNSDTMTDLARLGFGLVQAPRYRLQRNLDEGTLVEVLADYLPPPTPLTALYPQNRQLSPRVRVFLDWIVELFSEAEF
ncbi:LysR family transcriptional regulator, partial [Rhizobium lentis]|uniref:LysR substrate-binding domain-containing protein n=1 Tax=Rhizobium lentis TaxID=1138194 RepID=UPI002180A238